MKSHGSGQEASENKLDTFTRLLIPTEDQKNGAAKSVIKSADGRPATLTA